MRQSKSILILLLGVCLCVLGAQQQKIRPKILIKKPVAKPTIKVDLICHASKFGGQCPVTVMMEGKIHTTGPVSLAYYFKRSDGGTSQPKALTFKAAGSQKIPFKWKIGKDGTYSVQLIAKVGNKEIKSPQVGFMVDCDERRPIRPLVSGAGKSKHDLPQKAGAPKLSLQQGDVKQMVANVDLLVDKVVPIPESIRGPEGKVTIEVHMANAGKTAAPPCVLAITFEHSGYRGRPLSKRKIVFRYDIPKFAPGSGMKGTYPFKEFSYGWWRVKVKIDADNKVYERGRERNNRYPGRGASVPFEIK